MEDWSKVAAKTLVGKIRGRKYSSARLQKWTREIWGETLDCLPVVGAMTKGWFSLTFARPEHTYWVLKQFWHLELHPVHLKRWVPLFDPKKENAGAGPIWMRLPGLPLHF